MSKNQKIIIASAIIVVILILLIFVIAKLVTTLSGKDAEGNVAYVNNIEESENDLTKNSSLETGTYLFLSLVLEGNDIALKQVCPNYETKIATPISSFYYNKVYVKELEGETYNFINLCVDGNDYYYVVTIDALNNTVKFDETTVNTIEKAGRNEYDKKYDEYQSVGINLNNQIVAIKNIDARYYFDTFKYKLANEMTMAYNMLDQEYSQKRYDSFDEFKSNMLEYGNYILNSTIENLETISSKNELKFKNQYGDTFRIKMGKDHTATICLDNYTIPDVDDINKNYQNKKTKVKMEYQIQKIFEMINTGDYKHLYNMLDSRFKASNYNSVDALKTRFDSLGVKKWFIKMEKNATVEDDVYGYMVYMYDYNRLLAGETIDNGLTMQFVVKIVDPITFVCSFS